MYTHRSSKNLVRPLRRSLSIGLGAAFVSLLAVPASFAQAPSLPAFQETAKSPNFKDGKVVFEERRIRAYAYLGGDEHIIRQTVQRIVRQEGDAAGGWVYEWSVLGKYYEDRGDALVKTGLRRAALEACDLSG